jgi:hypothetical protein
MKTKQSAGGQSVKYPLSLISRAVFSIISISTWLLLFMLGMLIDSEPYRTYFADNPLSICTACMIVWTWTPINIGLLALLAGLIGGLNRGLLDDDPDNDHHDNGLRYYCWTGLVAGFVIYLAFMAGMILVSDDLFVTLTVEKYTKLASLLSITAIVAGLRPEFLEGLFSKVHDNKENNNRSATITNTTNTVTSQSTEMATSEPLAKTG